MSTEANPFAVSAELAEFRAVVRSFLAKKSPESAVRVAMESTTGHDPDLWSEMASQLGLQGLAVPESYGGAGASFVELGVVLEELGRSLACAPFFSTCVLATTVLLASGDDEACAEYLPAICQGRTTATVAFLEPDTAWDAGPTLQAEATAEGFVLTGTKVFVLDGVTSDLLLVSAATADGPSLFAVTAGATGLTRTSLATMDQTRPLATVTMAAVPARLVGSAGNADAALERMLAIASVALAAEQSGGSDYVLETAVGYAGTRVQFGQPIGSFQAIKHLLADVLVAVEHAKSCARYAAWSVDHAPEELPIVAAMAKSYCSEAFNTAASANVQVHGGLGFTWEHSAHLYLKRAQSSALLFGTPRSHRAALAGLLNV